MTAYLPIIISAIVIFTALMWWLLALGSVKKDASTVDSDPAKAVPAPPVAAARPPAAKVMDDPKPAARKAAPEPQAPLKAGATKATATRTAKATQGKTAASASAAPKTVAPRAAAPKTAPASKPKAAAKPVIADNLLLLKGLGPKVNAMLRDMGITRFAQVASWTPEDIAEIDPKLGVFAGRITRDNWVEQAQLLAEGDIAGFEAKYGALGGNVSKG